MLLFVKYEFFGNIVRKLHTTTHAGWPVQIIKAQSAINTLTFLGTPMRHRGVHVGNFFLGEKEGGQALTDAAQRESEPEK